MGVTFVDKVEGIVQIIRDGKYTGMTVSMADTVISVPPEGYRKVYNIYIDPVTEKLVVSYED